MNLMGEILLKEDFNQLRVAKYLRRICKVMNEMNLYRSPATILGIAFYFSKEFNQITSARLVGISTTTLRAYKQILRYYFYEWNEERGNGW